MSAKSVTIFTTFSEISEAYSLNRIVKDQLKMLLSHGYAPTVIVTESFEPEGIYADPRVTIKRIPNVPVYNEVKKDDSFDDDVKRLEIALREILKETDVVLTHDIIYQNACLKHNMAARKVAESLPNLKWLHWIHSATSPITLGNLRNIFSDEYINLVTKPFPNSFYIFFNDYAVPKIAKEFGVSQSTVKVVHHPSDLGEVLGLSDRVYRFAREKDLFSADAICIYPIRLDRGKQVEVVIKTMAMMKDFDFSIRVIIVDFHSTGGDKVTYRDELKNLAIDWELNSDEIIWTSEAKEEWDLEVSHDDVMGLMRLGNVFIMPSVSESYSLITQEAGLNKSVVVLNQDFPPFRDIFGPSAIYRKYSSRWDIMAEPAEADGSTDTVYGPGSATKEERPKHERDYHRDTAGMIIARLLSEKSLSFSIFLRKFRNLDYIFKHELEPLFYMELPNG